MYMICDTLGIQEGVFDEMSKAQDTTMITLRIDRDTKERADELFQYLGMNTSTAIRMFLAQSVHEWRMPFRADASKARSRKLESALKESDEIISGQIKAKKYGSFDELLNDI